jgi:hypothetical protein
MKDTFLNRPIFDEKTLTWKFSDGSGVIPEEMRQDLLLAQEKKSNAGTNGVYVLATLWAWKERLKKIIS